MRIVFLAKFGEYTLKTILGNSVEILGLLVDPGNILGCNMGYAFLPGLCDEAFRNYSFVYPVGGAIHTIDGGYPSAVSWRSWYVTIVSLGDMSPDAY